MTVGQNGSKRDVPGWAQVFGSVFAVILAAVTAATMVGATVAILAAMAAGAACASILVGLNQDAHGRRKKIIAGGCAGGALVLATVAAAIGILGRQATAAGQDADEPVPIMSSTSYRLTPSAWFTTNDQDKVDLDTGCPGHGPTTLQVGPTRCGEKADLILSDNELLTWERQPRLVPISGDELTYAACRKSLDPLLAFGSVAVDELRKGSGLCVSTDKGAIAAVRIENTAGAPGIEISFKVWVPRT